MEYIENHKKALDLEVRRDIFELVTKYAGCHFREIERKSNLPTGNIRYHLNYLVKHNIISEIKEGKNIRYFPQGFKSKNKKLLSLLRQESIRKILLFVLTHKNCNHEAVVKFVNLSPSTVSWHLKRLQQELIVKSTKKGRNTSFNILIEKEEIINLLITYQESFFDGIVNNIIDMWDM